MDTIARIAEAKYSAKREALPNPEGRNRPAPAGGSKSAGNA
jgi:hypothetical protein